MDVGTAGEVIAMDVARDEMELLVVTENGYGKRTKIAEYPSKGRGTKGVLTAKLTAKKGGLAGALIVREHQELLFISQNGMVQRTGVKGISLMGRATQGVRVMNLKKGDVVSALALVVEDSNGDKESGQTDLAAEEAAAEEAIAEKGKVKRTKSSGASAPAAKPKKPAAKRRPPAKKPDAKKPRRKPPPKKR